MAISSFAFMSSFIFLFSSSALLCFSTFSSSFSSWSSKVARTKGMTDQSPRRDNNSLKSDRTSRRMHG